MAAFAVAAVSEIVTDFVRRFDCRNNHIFRYGEGHIVDALFGDASLCSNDLVFFFGEFFSDDFTRARIGHKVVQANGETYFVAEVENFVEFFFGAVFKHELADCAECDDFAVHTARVNVVNRSQTVVDCVRSGKTARLESETGKKNVGFDDFFKSGGYDVAVASSLCFCAVADEVAIAKFGKCRCGVCAVAEKRAFLSVCAAGKTRVDVGYAVDVCSCLEVGGKSVAHTAYEEASRCVCDDVEVDKNDGRALTEVCVIVKFVIVGVKNGRVGSRCVRCRDGGADDERIACRNALRSVDCFAAAKTDGAVALVCFCKFLQRFHDRARALAFEKVAGNEFDAVFLLGRFEFFFDEVESKRVSDKKRFLTEGFYKITKVQQFVFALNVLCGTNKCFSHNNLLFIRLFFKVKTLYIEQMNNSIPKMLKYGNFCKIFQKNVDFETRRTKIS